ncbi:MAG TPA: ABC transporter ATP-binding protein [Streptosporangiaceae bacterium]|nr:ABC transporter ATP-binding protein [Streptosporangiaceae bacterium]
MTERIGRAPSGTAGTREAGAQAAVPWTRRDPVLEIRGLCVDYGMGEGAVHAVTGASLVLRRGEVLGLAGESGSGKSTLAYAATRLLREPGVITGGEVLFHPRPADGNGGPRTTDLLAAGERELRRVRWSEIAVVMQSALNALNPVISIGAQLDDVLRAHMPELGRAGRRRRAAELLEMVGITADRLGSYPHELSGGMRQRAMIAMALALSPQVVIMDEPTTALDVVTQREILEELIRLRDQLGFAALFITHDLSLLIELADEIAVMYAGRIVERAPAGSLFRAPRHPYTYGLLNSFPPMHGERVPMEGIPGSPPDLHAVPPGCAFHPRCPHVMPRCPQQAPPLCPPGAFPGTSPDGGSSPGASARREVACWLHDKAVPARVPGELAQPEPSAPQETVTVPGDGGQP